MERDAQSLVQQETLVVMSFQMHAMLKQVFDACKEKGQEDAEEVEAAELVPRVAEEQYFEDRMNMEVRENLDGQRETLYDVLLRVQKTWKAEMINLNSFLGFFSKRGRLREGEVAKF